MLTESLFTIGHSTRPLDELIGILHDYNVTILGDVRSYPRSRTNPQFNSETLTDVLPQRDIEYAWLRKLGGRRQGFGSKSKNTCWKNLSFRNYADYMETPLFQEGFAQLVELTQKGTVAIMCGDTVLEMPPINDLGLREVKGVSSYTSRRKVSTNRAQIRRVRKDSERVAHLSRQFKNFRFHEAVSLVMSAARTS